MSQYIAAIDQGTTSTRCMVFDHAGAVVAVAQKEHQQIFPRAGWVEHDPLEIWANVREVVGQALARADLTGTDLAAVGLTNQRETTVVWDKTTGEPVYNAIVWQDTRTDRIVTELGAARRRGRPLQGEGRPAAGHLLRRAQGDLGPGQRRGCPRARRAR
ncbi:FGGY family carbohydrate kinase [Geodermatophilus sp. URMC 63]